jgi:hypothetical protein
MYTVTSDSAIDAISLANMCSPDGAAELVKEPEFAQYLREYLTEAKIAVTFTKRDGSIRRLLCTKMHDLIPTDKLPTGTGKTPTNDAVAAFDVEKQEWRSFNTSNITRIEWKV